MREIKVCILLFWLSFTVRSQQDVSPPRILNGEEILGNGGPVTLTCEGDEPLAWTYKYLNCHYDMGKQNQTSKTDGSYQSQLTLNNQNSQGHYHCHYENTSLSDPGASVSTYVYLFSDEERFAEMDPDRRQGSSIKGNICGQVVLDCRPTQPNLTVVVEHGDEEIHRGPLEDPRAGYELRNLTEDSSGEYRCSVHNFSKTFEVEVQGTLKPPKLGITKNTFPVVGYSMKLFCQIPDNKFQSEPTFTWTRLNKDNRTVETLPEHRRVQSHMYYTSYLLVQNVTLEDSGTYECTVNTEGRPPLQTATYISIRESEAPFLKVSPVTQNITLREGDQLVWKLEVESFPPFPIFQTSSKFNVTQDEDGTTELKKERVKFYDFGEHTVNISTRSHSLGVKTAQVHLYLKVERETRLWIWVINAFISEYDIVMNRPNSTGTIGCNGFGYPIENITWHYQSCPMGEPCLQPFSDLKCSQITYAVHKEDHHYSECTFVATESARIICRSGDKVDSKDIVVSEFADLLSFTNNVTCTIEDLSATSYCTVKETDSFALTCAASKFLFDSVELRFSPTDGEVFYGEGKELSTFNSSHHNHIGTFDVANASRSHQGRYKCRGFKTKLSYYSEFNKEQRNIYLDVIKERRNILLKNYRKVTMAGDAFTFDCSYFDPPPKDIIWTKDGQPLPSNFGEFRENNQMIMIPHLDPTIHTGHYVCETERWGRSVRGFLTLFVQGEVSSKTLEVTVGIVAPFFICLLVVVLVLLRKVRRDFLKRRETEKNLAFLFQKGRPNELNPNCTADGQAELLPYDHKWEVSRDRIQLGQQLGAGAFGRVVKATVSNLEPGIPKTAVALKMCKMQADTTQITALTQELKIMIHIGKHLNIVNLMGAYTANVGKGELWILVEFCRYGSLLPFLHCHRVNFENVIDPITDSVNFSGRDGKDSISPFSPILKSPESVKSSSDPQSVQTASPNMNTSTKPCEILFESPASPKVLFSSSKPPNEDTRDRQCQASSPRIFRLVNSLPSKMKMVQNPSYQTVPAVESTAAPEEAGSEDRSKKEQSLKVLDSQGNYCKNTIPGVTSSFTTVDLICWAWQVAEGMDYLTHRKVLHGDLAARNLLLAEDNVVKISDFGLSRDIYKDDIYLKQTNDLLPVKWMSIEAIRDKMFSIQSDVWSFGVTLWELFSLGSTPYPGVKIDRTFLLSLQDGYRMEKPEYANNDLYKIMCQCWESVPQDRPSFRHLADKLSKLLMPETTQYFNIKNGEYLNMNKERFKQETDYLEMVASPDIRHITRDGESKCEDGVHGTGKTNHDPQMLTESTTADPDQRTGYLPMSSGTRSPSSSSDIFSPIMNM